MLSAGKRPLRGAQGAGTSGTAEGEWREGGREGGDREREREREEGRRESTKRERGGEGEGEGWREKGERGCLWHRYIQFKWSVLQVIAPLMSVK